MVLRYEGPRHDAAQGGSSAETRDSASATPPKAALTAPASAAFRSGLFAAAQDCSPSTPGLIRAGATLSATVQLRHALQKQKSTTRQIGSTRLPLPPRRSGLDGASAAAAIEWIQRPATGNGGQSHADVEATSGLDAAAGRRLPFGTSTSTATSAVRLAPKQRFDSPKLQRQPWPNPGPNALGTGPRRHWGSSREPLATCRKSRRSAPSVVTCGEHRRGLSHRRFVSTLKSARRRCAGATRRCPSGTRSRRPV